MRSTLRLVMVGFLVLWPVACGEATGTPAERPSPVPTTVETRTPAVALPTVSTVSASATLAPSPSPTATLDSTRSAAMTLEAIRLAVTASGVPEGSMEFEQQVAATRCAVMPPPTATPLPWQLSPQQPYLIGANCLGSDLPGVGMRIWQDGTWIEADGFLLADPADLEAARQRYLAFLGVISFTDSPPDDGFAVAMAELMASTGVLSSPDSCLADEISDQVNALVEDGQYVRLTFQKPIKWGDEYYLLVSQGDMRLALPWSTGPVLQELVTVATNAPAKQALLPGLSGTARLEFDPIAGQWKVADDAGGYYCQVLPLFVE